MNARCLTICPILAALLFGCSSPTKDIAQAANAARDDIEAIQDDAVATAQSVEDMSQIATPYLPIIAMDPFKAAHDRAAKMTADIGPHSEHLGKQLDRISEKVTETHDNEPQWLSALKLAAWIVVPSVIVFALWYSGILGWIGIVLKIVKPKGPIP